MRPYLRLCSLIEFAAFSSLMASERWCGSVRCSGGAASKWNPTSQTWGWVGLT